MRLLFLLFLVPAMASAQDLRVLSGGAAKSLVDPLAASFKGGKVSVQYQPMGRLTESLAQGAEVDMVIVTEETLPRLEREGRVQRGARPIARVGIGVAVHEKAPAPDISTVDAFRKTLLAAKSIVYIDPRVGTSGKHVAQVLSQLGIAEQVNAKAKLGSGGYVVEPVGRGEIELGIHQISEILPVKGVKLVGPLPAEFQRYTVYAGALAPGTPRAAAVREFLRYLSSPEARAGLAKAGYSAPE